jgi:leucyl-tRNA---protein transferase
MNLVKTYNEEFYREIVSLSDWDKLLAAGWDRVGIHFFRRRFDFVLRDHAKENDTMYLALQLMPLRYRLNSKFTFTKSQRELQRKNSDLTRIFRPAYVDDAKLELFDRWYMHRFKRYAGISQWFFGEFNPFPTYELCLYKMDKLVAVSFFDITQNAQYSTLSMYDPDEMKRSLGTYTTICEIEFGFRNRKFAHYPGHTYHERSMYEYKKRFNNAEFFDWEREMWRLLRG